MLTLKVLKIALQKVVNSETVSILNLSFALADFGDRHDASSVSA